MTFQFVLMESFIWLRSLPKSMRVAEWYTRSGMRRALRAAVTMMGAVAEWR